MSGGSCSANSSISGDSDSRSRRSSAALPNWTNPALYKTRLCDHYRRKSECKFGRKCWFAHGRQELRQVPRLDMHPEAEVDALAQVIEALPPSRCREVAMNKGHQLTQQMLANHDRYSTHGGHLHVQWDNVETPPPPVHTIPQIERLRKQLQDVEHQRTISHDGSYQSLNSTFDSDMTNCLSSPLPPMVTPLKSRHRYESSDLPDMVDLHDETSGSLDEHTVLPEINDDDSVFHCKVAKSPVHTVDSATNTDPHFCFDDKSVRAAAGFSKINPSEYGCFLEYGGLPVRFDRFTHAFAYPE
ncbi:unnamed protein product [Bursaphelenchus xylophilus]|uniref:(pine wood nematode) hypothetical protein n=1 Tax=Bursaphelenchus xylophilus TaxID=6326 RepID=A0A1I7RV01_BURXY|nr:unnamed protein product [Bursaphelenchus xylophilus]CAG9105251.1 unnamed protein product [Bursaphelenchus xylophilus]